MTYSRRDIEGNKDIQFEKLDIDEDNIFIDEYENDLYDDYEDEYGNDLYDGYEEEEENDKYICTSKIKLKLLYKKILKIEMKMKSEEKSGKLSTVNKIKMLTQISVLKTKIKQVKDKEIYINTQLVEYKPSIWKLVKYFWAQQKNRIETKKAIQEEKICKNEEQTMSKEELIEMMKDLNRKAEKQETKEREFYKRYSNKISYSQQKEDAIKRQKNNVEIQVVNTEYYEKMNTEFKKIVERMYE